MTNDHIAPLFLSEYGIQLSLNWEVMCHAAAMVWDLVTRPTPRLCMSSMLAAFICCRSAAVSIHVSRPSALLIAGQT